MIENSFARIGNNKDTTSQADYLGGIYRAICVDPKDPKKSGRIMVWIPSLHYTRVPDSEGMWARPCSPWAAPNLEESGALVSDFGALYVPPKDSLVYVFFEDGDVSKPVYIGGAVLEGAIPTENQVGAEWWNKQTLAKTLEKRLIFISDDKKYDSCILLRGKDRTIKRGYEGKDLAIPVISSEDN